MENLGFSSLKKVIYSYIKSEVTNTFKRKNRFKVNWQPKKSTYKLVSSSLLRVTIIGFSTKSLLLLLQ